jgi:hypothetical protein
LGLQTGPQRGTVYQGFLPRVTNPAEASDGTLAPLPLRLLGWLAPSDPLEIVLVEYESRAPQTLLDLDQRLPSRLRLTRLEPDERIEGDLGLVRKLAPRPADPYPCCSDLSATDHGATIAKRRPTDKTSGISCHYKGFFCPKTASDRQCIWIQFRAAPRCRRTNTPAAAAYKKRVYKNCILNLCIGADT